MRSSVPFRRTHESTCTQTPSAVAAARSARRSCSHSAVLFAIVGIAAASVGALGARRSRLGAVDRHAEAGRDRARTRRSSPPTARASAIVQSDVLREPRSTSRRSPSGFSNATIAIEDENFYEHDGVDYGAIVRAAIENVEAGEIKQGASTITQQLVRNLYIEDPEDTIERKIIEAEMAHGVRGGVHQGRDPRGVPQHRLLRDQRRHAPRSASRPPRRCSSTSTSPSSTSTRRRCSPACRRRRPTTTRSSTRTAPASAATRCSTRWSSRATSATPTLRPGARATGLGLERGYRYETREQQYFFDFVQQELIDALRRRRPCATAGSRSTRRSIPQLQAAAAAGDRRPAHHRRRRGGARLDRHRDRRDPRDGLLGGLRGQPVQPRRPGQAPARLVVQAVRAHDRGRPGHRPRLDLLLRPRARSRSTRTPVLASRGP